MDPFRNTRVTQEQDLNPNQAELFGFEDGYRLDLHFMPVAMRYRLDLAGLKIGLDGWLKIPVEERFALSSFSIGNPLDIESFQASFLQTALRCIGSVPHMIPRLDPRTWGKEQPIPASVKDAGAANGIVVEVSAWRRLGDLQRYALWKFSLSKRQPDSFRRAWEEFACIPET